MALADAVATYLFNSQLLPRPDGRLLLVAPAECREHRVVSAYLDRLLASGGPIAEVLTFDLRQSMRNGGGPACLRLRVALTAGERAAIGARVFLDDALAAELEAWIERHYRDRLAPQDLGDPQLVDEIAPRARCADADSAAARRLSVSACRRVVPVPAFAYAAAGDRPTDAREPSVGGAAPPSLSLQPAFRRRNR